MTDDIPILPGLSPVCGLDIHARFDGGTISSNGGALLLREAARSFDFGEMLGSCIPDQRDPSKVIHGYPSMIDARVVAIACGHEDCDDHDVMRHEPMLKMFCGKSPDGAVGLASQPTLSRLENTVSWRALARMGVKMIEAFCDSFSRPPQQIVLDIDDTTDLTHGAQQLSLFNTHAGGYCFQPILIFEAATQKPVAAILRGGKRPSGQEAASVIRHVVRQIRSHWPRVAITVRGDAHYGTPEVMDVLEDMNCLYIFGLSGNKRLAQISAPWRDDVATRRALKDKDKVRRFFQTNYGAKSWRRDRRVIARVEATLLGSDVRFIVTNITGARAKHIYQKVYCARGRMENLIKEHKLYLKSDRTSCHRWEANQFRLILHTAAYWLMLCLRNAAPKKSQWRNATFETIRNTFIKIAARVEQMKTRIRVSFPTATPNISIINVMLGKLAAQAP
ncbi:hypothetical protein AB838_03805 [Rhodobacteraceae bacterium (ex Bugula neritina AB1)]|nr:hypothetical protein AB838_03805 [Rhodobacteraceae bacterium (ex Bugula neritina AB1)]